MLPQSAIHELAVSPTPASHIELPQYEDDDDGDDDTHALPFQYWPDVQSVVEVFTRALPFQYWPDGQELPLVVPPPDPIQPAVVAESPLLADFVIGPSQ